MIPPPLCSSNPLQMVVCKEDGPPDDQYEGDGGARIVANDHPDDPASSVLLSSFANGRLQRGQQQCKVIPLCVFVSIFLLVFDLYLFIFASV